MSNKRFRRSLIWAACFCADSRAAILEVSDERLARLIQKGNLVSIERALRRLQRPLNDIQVVVKRRHLSTAYLCLVDHRATSADPFINFYQECSPVIWAVDCLQWHVLPLLVGHGYDINRPQTCRRWTYLCGPSSRPNTAPYRRFWTRGRYTYQSALDYYFASIYEFVGEQPTSYNGLSGPSPLAFYFSHLPTLLTKGVDVHRIDSVIVFNSLANSYDQYLCRYTNEYATVPDIPENDDGFVEMTAVKRLIENGFSQFECMDYLYPCCNWFGILLCLVCHPKIDIYGNNPLPSIIRQAALLLINFLSLRCAFPSADDFGESLENLHLRKVYAKRYGERRDEFNSRLSSIHHICHSLLSQPLSLKLLARNTIRKQIGGIDFCRKLSCVGLPKQLTSFVQYIGLEHLKSSHMPKQLIRLAQGEGVCHNSLARQESRQENEVEGNRWRPMPYPMYATSQQVQFETNVRMVNLDDLPSPIWSKHLRRGRASERHVINTKRLDTELDVQGSDYTTKLLPRRPLSAPSPLLRIF